MAEYRGLTKDDVLQNKPRYILIRIRSPNNMPIRESILTQELQALMLTGTVQDITKIDEYNYEIKCRNDMFDMLNVILSGMGLTIDKTEE